MWPDTTGYKIVQLRIKVKLHMKYNKMYGLYDFEQNIICRFHYAIYKYFRINNKLIKIQP